MSFQNILALMSGLSMFLIGMRLMSEGLELAAGSRLKHILEILTSNRIIGIIIGMLVTMLIQSSSATTVMVVGFVNAGIMTLAQAVGVIMGATIGTTITGVLVALNPKSIAPVALFIGMIFMVSIKNKRAQYFGRILAGVGLLFLGLNGMSSAMEPLRTFEPFTNIMTAFSQNHFLALLVGILVTVVLQSSSASVAILQALAMQGAVGNMNSAIFIIIGMNIGTCVTALLASIGTNQNAKRAAVLHLLFKLIGAAIFSIVLIFVPLGEYLAFMTDNVAAQIAIAHIIFNVFNTVVLAPFADMLVKMSRVIIPGEDAPESKLHLEFIDPRILNTPPVAVAQIVKEVLRMADLAKQNIRGSIAALTGRDRDKINEVYEREKLINFLNHNITTYLIKINALDLPSGDVNLVGALYHVVNDIERIGDHAENIADGALNCIESDIVLSETAVNELNDMFGKADELYGLSIERFTNTQGRTMKGEETGERINILEQTIDDMADDLERHSIERLNVGACSPKSSLLFVHVLSDIERIADHSTNIAYSIKQYHG